jgi:hypothetical protein
LSLGRYLLHDDCADCSVVLSARGRGLWSGVQVEDAKRGYMYGLQTLFRYYSYGLEADWHAGRFRDFQHAVLEDLERGSTYGLEKVRNTTACSLLI